MDYYLITFENTHSAMAAQKYLKDKIDFYTIPTLREISASCGISLKIEAIYFEILKKHIQNFPIDNSMYEVYHITGQGITRLPLPL